MTRRRAFTIIEMMVAVTMLALLVGAVTAVYAYTVERLGYSLAGYTTQREAEYGIDAIDHIVSVSQTCSQVSVSGNLCLKCILPANCSVGGDGITYTCSPNAINRLGLEKWGNGTRVWFYLASSVALPNTPGSILWMATVSDDSTPTAANVVEAFSYYPGNSKIRLDLMQAFATSAGTFSNQTQASVSVGSYTNGDVAAPTGSPSSTTSQATLSRTSYERGWRS